ncbi:hypothetical protein NA57DRAFT_76182 [Rhizodiscina lignyota]|uniref:Tyrosine specific protein phosphatases domain-containing protein n=1 Tax=Rhizodiscina lignyota TaxID=1504668 RepID=A0A9P4MAP4_9PEZI|nr:hypothetical protein NA57DRAFT_76182 [Rhizodiscina lignyota]
MASLQTPLPSILNFRDVGKTINDFTGLNKLQEKKLYRSARLDNATAEDRKRLIDEFAIKSVIDLRTETEHIENSKKRNQRIKANAQEAEPLKIPGIAYHEINFNGKGYSNSLIKQLTWHQFFRLIRLMAMGYRTEGIRVLGENVMRARGLTGLAVDSIDACTKEVKQVFDVLSNPESYPVLVHCTQGKDRTGLVVMLVLQVLVLDVGSTKHDYMLSEAELAPEREERLKEIESIGLTEEFARCDPLMVKTVYKHILDKYGGIDKYLSEACGVDAAAQDRVRRIMERRWSLGVA